MSTPARVRILAPEFTSKSDSFIQDYLDIVATMVNDSVFGARAGTAKAYLAAHYMKVGDMKGRGSITQEDSGQIARSYASTDINNHELSSTNYGRMYLSIQRGNISSPIVV